MEKARIRIAEGGLSFFKPHSMLGPIAPIFPLVPLEPKHVYILSRYNVDCKRVARKASLRKWSTRKSSVIIERTRIKLVDVTGIER